MAAPSDLRREVLHERLLLAERSVQASAATVLVIVPVVAWLNRDRIEPLWLLGWLVAVWGVCLWRIWHARRIVAAPPPVVGADAMLRRMMLASLPGAAALVFTLVLFFEPDDPVTMLFVVVVPVLAFAGQVAAAAPPVRVIATLLGPGVAVMIVLCLLDDGGFTRVLAVVLAVFSLAMLRIARNIGATLDREIALKIENRELARSRDAELARADEASRAKSRFLAAASHDIRQPVHALDLFLGAFEDDTLQGRNRALIGQLRACAHGLREMLDGVLDLSRADAGTIRAVPAPVSVQQVFDAVERDFGAIADAKGLVLRCVPSHRWVLADAFLLERIVRNLVSNAVRYTERGGVLLGARRRAGLVVIEVWDTGVGVPESDRETIFAEFARGSRAGTDAPAGLGLGLAIVRRFAAAMQGRVGFDSRVGRGSVFRIDLPPCEARERAPGACATPEPAIVVGLHVLVVEDDAAVRDATALLLRGWGCKVTAIADPAAIEDAPPPDVLITDDALHGRRQAEEAAVTAAAHAGRPVPTLVTTGERDPARIEALKGRGLFVLVKPVAPDALRAALQAIVAERAASLAEGGPASF